jgi:hypothetical protein
MGKLKINSSQINNFDPEPHSEYASNERPMKTEGNEKLSLKPWRIVKESDKDQNRENIGPIDTQDLRKYDDFDMVKHPNSGHTHQYGKGWFKGDSQPETAEPNRFYQGPKKILASLYDDFTEIEKNK